MDEQMQLQIVALVQAAMQGDQQAQQQVLQIMEAAQQGDPQAQLIAQLIQQIMELMQGQQALMAKFGAKLNYIKYLRGQCPDGYEMAYFKNGGKAGCKKCKKKEEGGDIMKSSKGGDIVKEFRCGRKMKKKACGGSVNKVKKGQYGTAISSGVSEKGVKWEQFPDERIISTFPDGSKYTHEPNNSLSRLNNRLKERKFGGLKPPRQMSNPKPEFPKQLPEGYQRLPDGSFLLPGITVSSPEPIYKGYDLPNIDIYPPEN